MGDDGLERISELSRAIRRRSSLFISLTVIVAIFVFFACIFIGSVNLDFITVINAMMGNATWGQQYIVMELRVPRLICAALVGASLSLAGMCMQALFKNPMASPSVLGISSGASFGAALYIAFGYTVFNVSYGTTAFAFVMAGVTMLLVYALAKGRGGVRTIMLLLAGMAISALFSGMTSTIEFFSDVDTVGSIVFWILGSFSKCNWDSVLLIIPPVLIGSILVLLCCRELNLISSGEKKARALGVNVRRVRIQLLIGNCLLVAGAVSVCGVISFVGLIIPHIFRALCGPDHRYLGWLCIFGGAAFLMLVDTVARSMMPPYEFPVGIITSMLGAPFFIYIMKRRNSSLWEV